MASCIEVFDPFVQKPGAVPRLEGSRDRHQWRTGTAIDLPTKGRVLWVNLASCIDI